ncbi:MAG: voltage-gated potassium channel [Euryarchaeota archaeon]|jgi:voltage-gated potassium channel|nr:voltage-gated potassium channel [Euryarchaeota archaeon]
MGLRNTLKFGSRILLLVAIYSIIFMVIMNHEHQDQNVRFVNAIYWVMITITTLGYGDIVFYSPIGRLFSVLVALSGVAILWAVVMPLIITPRLEHLVWAAPSSAPKKIQDHIIISGYNHMVDSLTKRLSDLNIPFLIIERDELTAKSIYKRFPTIWGDPSGREVLLRANLHSARLFITNEKDELDAEVILSIREISDIEIIELVSDLTSSRFLSYAGASRIISPKTMLGTFLAQIASPPKDDVFPGAIQLFGDLMLAELPIYPGSELKTRNLTIESAKTTSANIVAIWHEGVFQPNPNPENAIESNSVLMAIGNIKQLSLIRNLTLGVRREGPLIILGYGDVGRQVAKTLCIAGMKPVVVDRRNFETNHFVHIAGEATSEAILIEAGIRNAVGIMVLLHNDSEVIYCTLLSKNLNPDALVVARANRVESVEKIYRAGADYVASVPIVASHMLGKIIEREKEELGMLYEDLELKIFKVGKRSCLAGKSLEEIGLQKRFGCAVAAFERDGQAMAEVDQNTILKRGDSLAVIGTISGIKSFSVEFERKPILDKVLEIWDKR